MAGLDEAEDGGGDGLRRAGGDHEVVGGDAVVGREGMEKLGHTAQRRVLVVAGGDLLLGDLEHAGGAVRVWEALAKVHGVVLGGEGSHGGEDGLAKLLEALDCH